jgi:exosortase/archaeosortase family protein
MKQSIKNNHNKKANWYMNPFLQFTVISCVLLLLGMLFVSQMSVSVFFEKWTTIILNSIMQWFHFKTRMTGNFILLLDESQIKFQIVQDCTGIYPFIILTSLIVGFPAKLFKKLAGIGLAFLYTFVFNYLRLVLLFAIGRKSVKWFEIAHIFIWQVSFVLLVVIFFFWWVQWAKKINKNISHQ